MAKTVIYDAHGHVHYALDIGTSGSSDDFTLVGALPVYLLTDTDSNDIATVILPGSTVIDYSVTGADNAGNAAIAIGAKLYNDSGTINVDSVNGVFCGWALEAVSSGATDTIHILLDA